MSCGLASGRISVGDPDQRGKRHFQLANRKTSLYGSENGGETSKPVFTNQKRIANSRLHKSQERSLKYGDWWSPLPMAVSQPNKETFYGRMRTPDAKENTQIGGIAGFSLACDDSRTESAPHHQTSSNGYRGTPPEERLTREVQQPRGQSAFEEGNLEKADLPPSTATPPKANDHNQANAADSRDSLDYAGDDLIRRAEMRAHERQKRLMHEVGIDEASGYNERWDGGAHLDRSADYSPRPASIVGPPGPAEGQDPRHLTQKQLLERHMTDGRFINYVNRPPWHTTLDDNGTANGSRRRVEEPSPQNGPRDQRTTNQMDFPSYTVSEMSAARPLATNSRYERCTWLPNLAPDFDIEKRNKRLPASRVQQNHGEDSRDVGNGSSAALSALAKHAYGTRGRITAPYASHE
uniref:Uncharacterized protein n=3 Tax=Schistocephalus solidus TaxID=70667 RepID=A0A0X3PZB6_SCHSO